LGALRMIYRSVIIGVTMSLVEMKSHLLRSILSMLGVLLGVASLVAMLTLVGGIDVFLKEKMGRWMGSLWIWKGHGTTAEKKLSWSRSPGLHLSDGTHMVKESEVVERTYDTIQRRDRIHFLNQNSRARVRGVTLVTLEDDQRTLQLKRGRWLDKSDYETGRRNCLITWDLEGKIHKAIALQGRGKREVLGRGITFKNVRFTIVGVLEPIDPDYKPWHLRRNVIVPLKAMQNYVTGSDPNPGSIRISVVDPTQLHEQAELAARVLTERHRGVQDFEYRIADWAEQMTQMFKNISLLMSVLSMVSLMVGGLGIMNVMLSSISERMRELGTRKAMGAQNLQIFIQLVAETMTLSFVGGVFGVLVGVIPLFFKDAIKKGTQGSIAPTLLPEHSLYVFVVIVAVGIIFGLYPAIKASRLNPIDALRYE